MSSQNSSYDVENIRNFCRLLGRPKKRGAVWRDADNDLKFRALQRDENILHNEVEVVLCDSGQGFEVAMVQLAEVALCERNESEATNRESFNQNSPGNGGFIRRLGKEVADFRRHLEETIKKLAINPESPTSAESERGPMAGLAFMLSNVELKFSKFTAYFNQARELLCKNGLVNPQSEMLLLTAIESAFNLGLVINGTRACLENQKLLRIRRQQSLGKRPTAKQKLVSATLKKLLEAGNSKPVAKEVAYALDGQYLRGYPDKIIYDISLQQIHWGDGKPPCGMRSLQRMIALAR